MSGSFKGVGHRWMGVALVANRDDSSYPYPKLSSNNDFKVIIPDNDDDCCCFDDDESGENDNTCVDCR